MRFFTCWPLKSRRARTIEANSIFFGLYSKCICICRNANFGASTQFLRAFVDWHITVGTSVALTANAFESAHMAGSNKALQIFLIKNIFYFTIPEPLLCIICRWELSNQSRSRQSPRMQVSRRQTSVVMEIT